MGSMGKIIREGKRRGALGSNAKKRQDAFRWMRKELRSGTALSEVRAAMGRGDPVVSQFPRKARDAGPFVRPVPVPYRYIVLEDAAVITAGNESAMYRTDFTQGAGWLVGWRGTTRGDGSDAGRASLGVKANINGNEPLITNGQAEDYALFDCLYPKNSDTWSLLMLPMDIKDQLRTQYKNYHLMTSYTPHVVFAFCDGLDVEWLTGR